MPLVRNPILPGFNPDPSIVRVADNGSKLTLSTVSDHVLISPSECNAFLKSVLDQDAA